MCSLWHSKYFSAHFETPKARQDVLHILNNSIHVLNSSIHVLNSSIHVLNSSIHVLNSSIHVLNSSIEVEHGSFTPLVFSTTGGMGRQSTIFYSRLASLLARKRHQPYSTTMGWLRCHLSFSLLRSSILCIRGSRSSRHVIPRFPAATISVYQILSIYFCMFMTILFPIQLLHL